MPYEIGLRERHFPLLFRTAVVGCASCVRNAVEPGVVMYEPSSLNEISLMVASFPS